MLPYHEIFQNNKKWMAEKKANQKDFFEKLAQDQNPEILYIGCSDSRVTAEEIMGADPGEVFVHRNIANLVNTDDLNVLSVLEYAIAHLRVKRIIVCGHYNCGGVKAATTSKSLGVLDPWLTNIRDVYRMHQTSIEEIEDPYEKHKKLVELNVMEQCFNVIKTSVYQERYINEGEPAVHGWVFDMKTGELIDLKIDFKKELEGILSIYNLTGQPLKS